MRLILFLFMLLLIAGCTVEQRPSQETVVIVSSDRTQEQEMQYPTSETIMIGGNYFLPEEVVLQAPATILWKIEDEKNHQLSEESGLFVSGMLDENDSFSYTFTDAGVYTVTDVTLGTAMTVMVK